MERDLSAFYKIIGENHSSLAASSLVDYSAERCYELSAFYQQQAERRRDAINKYLWDEEDGLYYDYHFVEGKRRR